MAFLAHRISRGKKYWSIVESRRVNGKPRNIIVQYLGTAKTLLAKIQENEDVTVKSYSHGDTMALLLIAKELGIIDIINKHIPKSKHGSKQKRDSFTVGSSIVLAAIGRACNPTSKMGWYDWCKNTSLEYCLKRSLKKLDSQHYWDQMDAIPSEKIAAIEKDIVKRLVDTYKVKQDSLFFDTTNFFTFIGSTNKHCTLAQRGWNKQKRYDLRQIGLALLVSRKEQFPLFHMTYHGDKNDVTIFKEALNSVTNRLKAINNKLSNITLIFDRGNNSKTNFSMIDNLEKLYYVGGLVTSHNKNLIQEANGSFTDVAVNNENIPAYRTIKEIWGKKRTCIVLISEQLKKGQIQGIHQHYAKKSKQLDKFKRQLENPKKRKDFSKEEIEKRIQNIINGQFIKQIVVYDIIEKGNSISFTYYIDAEKYNTLKDEILGRKILVTNRHKWNTANIILAYRGQAKVEYAFRNLKNPLHLAVRPQYHWTDQKIEVHFLICIIGYLLTIAAYTKVRKTLPYNQSIENFMEDLKSIRLACLLKKKNRKVKYSLEEMPKSLQKIAKILHITDKNLRINIDVGGYK